MAILQDPIARAAMTSQEVAKYVIEHLIAQGERAHKLDYGCRYRHEGKACAVGCLITDKEYHATFEGTSVGSIVYSNKQKELENFINNHLELLKKLQRIHDQANFDDTDKSVFINWVKLNAPDVGVEI